MRSIRIHAVCLVPATCNNKKNYVIPQKRPGAIWTRWKFLPSAPNIAALPVLHFVACVNEKYSTAVMIDWSNTMWVTLVLMTWSGSTSGTGPIHLTYRRNSRIRNVSCPIAKAVAFGICMGKSQNLGTLVCGGASYTQVLSFHLVLSYPRVSTVTRRLNTI